MDINKNLKEEWKKNCYKFYLIHIFYEGGGGSCVQFSTITA